MESISAKHVVLGGLVTGLVINVGETLLNAFLIGSQYAEAMMGYGVAESPHSVAIFTVYGFALGIVTIWLYAAARAQLGPGPKAAVLVGLAVGFIYAGSFADFHLAIPLFPTSVPLTNLAWGMVELPLATLAGAWVYRAQSHAGSASG